MASEAGIEDRISGLLWYGVAASATLTLLGMAFYVTAPFQDAHSVGDSAIIAGVILLLLTPAARVAMLFLHYVHLRDNDYILITLFVLLMMALGYISGAG